jgi:hypothetical protein
MIVNPYFPHFYYNVFFYRLFQQAEDELRNMERMVSLTLKLEASTAAEKSSKKTPRTGSPQLKEAASSPKAKKSSSKSETRSPPKEKTKPGRFRVNEKKPTKHCSKKIFLSMKWF